MSPILKFKGQKGFTLVEVLLALAIGTIIMSAILTAVMQGYSSSSGIEQSVSVQEDVRAALDMMSHEIAMASYSRVEPANIQKWRATDGTPNLICSACSEPTTCQYKGIQEATANIITVEMDNAAPEDGVIGGPNEVIRYEYISGQQRITRATGCSGNPEPFLSADATATLKAKNVAVTNTPRGISLFQYYDGSDAEILPAALPAKIPDIRRVKINIAVQATVADSKGQKREMIYSTSVLVRNHAKDPTIK
jgi:prepilin-type N-terminal cleavage/methylation domain-containing protein